MFINIESNLDENNFDKKVVKLYKALKLME